jgi:hypothetical protein
MCRTQLILLDLVALIIFDEEHKSQSCSCIVFQLTFIFPLLGPKFPSHSLLEHTQCMFFPYRSILSGQAVWWSSIALYLYLGVALFETRHIHTYCNNGGLLRLLILLLYWNTTLIV